MNTAIKSFTGSVDHDTFFQGVVESIGTNGLVFIEGGTLKDSPFFQEKAYSEFADSWNHLTQDNYMGDKGTYRYRRYSQFSYKGEDGSLHLLPHTAYVQPSYINPLNGGIERHFDPLEDHVVKNDFFTGLLRWCGEIFNHTKGENNNWNIKIHPYRIIARSGEAGLPTPEGVHRDGVDFIFMMLIKRQNIIGGMTTIYDSDKREIGETTLTNPLDILIADDEKTMHGVTSIQIDQAGNPAYRDVLVVAYTKE